MEVTEGALKKNNGEIVVGFDLSDSFSQISYGYVEGTDVDTLSTVAGTQNYLVPTALFKRREVNQWYVGREAIKNAGEDGIFIDKLLTRARAGEEVKVSDESFRPVSLLSLFMKRTLTLVNMVAPVTRIAAFMVTVDELDTRMVEILSEAVSSLGLKTENIFFQSHMESFYYYMTNQPAELWQRNVLLLDFSESFLKTYRMECNNNTTPIVAFIDPMGYPTFSTAELKETVPDSAEGSALDTGLLEIVSNISEGRIFSSVYLIGDNFSKDCFKETLKLLCRKARVFEGNNLYSKGAAFSARNKIFKTILSESYVFLGNDKLKSNIGMNVYKRGEKAYLALLDAGINWFEASRECDVYLDQGNKLSFVITPLTGKNPEVVDITLEDLPKRPARTTRLHISVKMNSESKMAVNVKDMGFGELFPAGNVEWNEVIDV